MHSLHYSGHFMSAKYVACYYARVMLLGSVIPLAVTRLKLLHGQVRMFPTLLCCLLCCLHVHYSRLAFDV